MKFGKRAGVSVVLDENRQLRKLVRQSLFQPDAAPAGQMRRIDQDAFGDLQRPACRNADRQRLAARSPRGFNRFLYQTGDSRKGIVERSGGFGRDLFALQNLGARRAFNDRRLRPPNVQADDRLIHKVHFETTKIGIPNRRRTPQVRREKPVLIFHSVPAASCGGSTIRSNVTWSELPHFLFGMAFTNDDCQSRSNRRIASASSFCSCWPRTSMYFVSISRTFFSSSPGLTGTTSTSAPLARRRLSASISSPSFSWSFR